MFRNMKVGSRLALGFSLVLVLMVAIIGVSLRKAQVSREKLERIVKVNNVRVRLANDMIDDARETAIDVRNILLAKYKNDSSESIKKIRDHLAELRRTYSESLAKIKELVPEDDKKGLELLSNLEASEAAARQLQDQVIELAVAGQHAEGTDLMTEKAYPTVKQWIDETDNLIRYNEERTALRYDEAEKAADVARTTMFILGVVAIALSVAIVIFLTLGITRPLNLSVRAANRIASGDLTMDLSTAEKRGDELGFLIQSFSKMVENIRRSTADISEAVNLLGSSASEILASTTQVASGTAETATAISETTTTVEEVRQAARLSSDKAKNVSDSAQRVGQVSQSGRKAVEETAAGMLHIRDQMESIAQTIVRLSEQSQSIGGIIASVTDLADQSNLLAVNAASEAARAGEQGKGFAVVAQEIKSLAEQSKQATMQIRGILNDVQKATSAAVMATEQGSKAVEAGVRQSAQAGEAIRVLAESSGEAAQTATQIVASSQQQVVGMDQIGTAMENINQAGAQTAASMRQAEVAAQNLHELGQKLKRLVEQYKM